MDKSPKETSATTNVKQEQLRKCTHEILKNRIPINNRGIFREWTYLAKCEDTWETLADEYFRKLQPKTRPIPVNNDAEKIMSLNRMILTSFDQFLSENPKFRMRRKKSTHAHPLVDGYPQLFITLQDNNTKNNQDLRFNKLN